MAQGTHHSVEEKPWRKIIAGLFISLDGVVEAPTSLVRRASWSRNWMWGLRGTSPRT